MLLFQALLRPSRPFLPLVTATTATPLNSFLTSVRNGFVGHPRCHHACVFNSPSEQAFWALRTREIAATKLPCPLPRMLLFQVTTCPSRPLVPLAPQAFKSTVTATNATPLSPFLISGLNGCVAHPISRNVCDSGSNSGQAC